MDETGVTTAAVPVKKHPTKFDNSDTSIFLSNTLIFFVFAISIIVRLVIPSKKESGVGVCKLPSLSLKKYLHQLLLQLFLHDRALKSLYNLDSLHHV